MDKEKVVAAVPVYNEADRIGDTVAGLKNVDLIDEILIINDGSVDNTAKIIKKLNVSIITVPQNQGKGYAMKIAIKKMDYDYIAFVDGDLGFTSTEVVKLIEPVVSGEVDFTIAKFDIPKIKGGFGFVKDLAKKGVFFHTREEMDTSLSGQRVYRKEVIESMRYIPTHYGIEVAMTIQAINNGYKFKEIPVSMTHRYSDRSFKGFKHRGRQFWDIFKTLLYISFRR